MKNFYKHMLAFAVISGLSCKAYAYNFYFKGEAGLVMPSKLKKQNFVATDKGIGNVAGYGIELGYQPRNNIKLGANLGFARIKTDNYSANNISLIEGFKIKNTIAKINAQYSSDYFASTALKPYVTGGLGIGRNKVSNLTLRECSKLAGALHDSKCSIIDFSYEGKKTNFVWSIGLGILSQITDEVEFDFGYEYRSLGSLRASITGSVDGDYPDYKAKIYSHNIKFGTLYRF